MLVSSPSKKYFVHKFRKYHTFTYVFRVGSGNRKHTFSLAVIPVKQEVCFLDLSVDIFCICILVGGVS